MIPADAQAFGLEPDSPLTVQRWTMYGHPGDTLAIVDSRDPHGAWIVRIVGPEFGPEPDPIHPDHIPGALLDGCTLAAEYFPADDDSGVATRTLRMRAGDGLAELAERLGPDPRLEQFGGFQVQRQLGGGPLHNGADAAPVPDGWYWSRDFASEGCWGPFDSWMEAVFAAESGTVRGDGYGGAL